MILKQNTHSVNERKQQCERENQRERERVQRTRQDSVRATCKSPRLDLILNIQKYIFVKVWCKQQIGVFFVCFFFLVAMLLKKSHFANEQSCIMRIPHATARTPEFTASSAPLTTERKELALQKKRKEKDYSTSREEPNISQLNVSLRLDFDSVQQSVNLNQVWCMECGFPHTAGIQQMRMD